MSLNTLKTLSVIIAIGFTHAITANASVHNAQKLSNNSQQDVEEMVVKAPTSKRDLLRAREDLSERLIAKLNASTSGENVIVCGMENTIVNASKAKRKLLRVCATKGTHDARRKIKKHAYLKCGTPSGSMLPGDRITMTGPEPVASISENCSPNIHKYKMKAIRKEQNRYIDERVKALMQEDPEFAQLIKQATKLKFAYDHY